MAKKSKLICAPDIVTGSALVEWHRIVGLFQFSNEALVALVAAYCISWARWAESEKRLGQDGCEILIRDDKGTLKSVVPSPWIGIGAKAFDRMLKCAKELGIGPGHRAVAGKPADSTSRSEEQVSAEWFQ